MGNVSEVPLCFKWVEKTSQFNEDVTKSYNEDSNIGCFLEVDVQVQYPEELHDLYNNLPFFPEWTMKIENVEKLEASVHHKKEYVIHIKNFIS